MVKLSRRTRYGILAVLDLASDYGPGPVQLRKIAARQHISEKYLEQLMMALRSAGIVRSVMGPRGGYMLAKGADQVKLSECFLCLEGPVITAECVEDGEQCSRSSDCLSRKLWVEVHDAVMSVLESKTLQDLIDESELREEIVNYAI